MNNFVKNTPIKPPLLFRFHRGLLDESMQTVIEIKSFDHLKRYICETLDMPLTKIIIEPYIYDPRIDWDTHIVKITVGLGENRSTYPCGFLNRACDE